MKPTILPKPHQHTKHRGATYLPGSATEGAYDDFPIVVHSHLRWDWVWQRPQQFLSRLSRRHPVLFIEDATAVEGLKAPQAKLHQDRKFPNVHILRPEFPSGEPIAEEAQWTLVRDALSGSFGRVFADPVQWFYSPMAARAFAGRLNARAIVYDCMDQLSQFRGAPPELVVRERELLSVADVVFAGGPKIHSAKSARHLNCHCYGCGVDIAHFGKARLPDTAIPHELAGLPRPTLGYFGVVDERMDYDLVDALAAAHPEWSVVIIGPTAKVDPAEFPQRPNLHWFGGRDYQELPAYVKGFDVCLMPFAINAATEYINPTKALEYMATATPIVSTAVQDVVLQFSHIVDVARSHTDFITACEKALAHPNRSAIRSGVELAATQSWEAIVEKLERHILDALPSKPVAPAITTLKTRAA